MRIEPAAQSKSAAASKEQVTAVLNHALEDRPAAVASTKGLVDSLAQTPAHLQVVLLTSSGPESRLVADMVTRFITGAGIPKAAVCAAMNRTPTSWPSLSRTTGARSIALLEDGESVGAALATAWLRKLARDDNEQATVFIELAGPQRDHAELIEAVKLLTAQHKPLVELHVIDLAVDAKSARD